MSSITVLVLLLSIFVNAQKSVDVELVKDNDEIINGKMRIFSPLFDKNAIDIRSFLTNVILVDENGKKVEKIKAKNIKELKYINFQGETFKYFNDDASKYLKREIYVGAKIKWIREFSINIYDSSLIMTDVFFDEKNKKVKVGMFNSLRKKLKELTISKPELAEEIDKINYDDREILSIIKKYEED